MNKKLASVWGLWVLQVAVGISLSIYNRSNDMGRGSPFWRAQLMADDLAESWCIYAVLASGVFIGLTTWALRGRRPQIPK